MNIMRFLKVFRKTFLTPLKPRTSFSQCSEDLIVEQFFISLIKKKKKGYMWMLVVITRKGVQTLINYIN